MELFKALWRGDVPLAKTFWLFGFCVNLLLNFAALYFVFQPQLLSNTIGWIIYMFIVLFSIVYGPFILIAIWRSANKYKGSSGYSMLAKVAVIVGWGGYFRNLSELAEIFLP